MGARTCAQLVDNLEAAEITLKPHHLERLDAATEIELGFPHDFLGRDGTASQFIYGEYLDRLQVHRGELAE